MNKFITVLCSVILFSQMAFAADESCDAKATKQRLAGMARFNFVKRCEATLESARKICEARAADKRLMGEAKDNFIKKCTIAESN
ncbi:MAG TPA: hypothetical protein VFQ97_02035 [Gallionella sp.]|nr:hypothetical protein [Gallionella sp.]